RPKTLPKHDHSYGAEYLLQLVRRRHLELIVAAVFRLPVWPPAQERAGVAEAIALHVVVLDLADALDPQRLPRQILACTPAALSAGHAGHVRGVELRPLAPRMAVERVLAQRRQFRHQLTSSLHGERRGDADVVQRAAIVVEPEQQRPD